MAKKLSVHEKAMQEARDRRRRALQMLESGRGVVETAAKVGVSHQRVSQWKRDAARAQA